MHVGDPVAQRLVHGIFQRLRARRDGVDLGTQQLHAEHVGALSLDVDCAHEDLAGQVELGADRGDGDAVLAGAGLGDDARLAHALGEQDLAQAVVDLVAAGVIELVALEVDFRATQMLGQALGEIERARPAGIVRVERVELLLEGRVRPRILVGPPQLQDQRHQGFGDEAPTENAEESPVVGAGPIGVELGLLGFFLLRCHSRRPCHALDVISAQAGTHVT